MGRSGAEFRVRPVPGDADEPTVGDVTGTPATTDAVPEWERHPADVARFVVAAVVTAALTGFAWLFADSIYKVSTDLVRLLRTVPDGLTFALVGIVQILVTVTAVVAVGWLIVERRWRVLGLVVLASGVGALTMWSVGRFLGSRLPAELERSRVVESWIGSGAFPSAPLLAAAAAVATVSAAFVPRSWYRIAMYTVVAVAFLRVLTMTETPMNLALILAVGVCAGSAALVITGAPHRRIDPDTIRRTLEAIGIPTTAVTPTGHDRVAPRFRAHDPAGGDRHVLVLGRDLRDQDLVLRAWRSLRTKGFSARRPVGSPRRVAENEQLGLAFALAADVVASRPVAIGFTPDKAALSITTWVDGASLGQLDPADITEEMLVDTWRQVARLHARRVAHGALDVDHVVVEEGRATLVGFRLSAIDATDEVLSADVAELLCSIAARVGVDRTVAAARRGLHAEVITDTLPLLQPLVVSGSTREAMKTAEVSLTELRDGLQEAVGAEAVTLAPVGRVTVRGVVSLVGSVVLASYVFTLASDWRSIADAFGVMNWAAVPLLLALVLTVNAGGALSMMGSLIVDLPFLRTNQIMFAQGFLNRFTPANAGGMALRARYLQREGVELNVGAAAVGLTSAASGILQAILIVVFLVWGGASDQLSRFQFPATTRTLVVVVAVAAAIGGVILSSWGRRVVVPWLSRTLGPALASFAELARRPRKLGQLFGGAALAKLATIAAFALCVSAMGVNMDFARIGALYMVANTVGAAVPTPGGVGGIEAALTAALISAGVDAPTAGAIVLIFRLFTFWLPTLPGWAFLQRVQRAGVV